MHARQLSLTTAAAILLPLPVLAQGSPFEGNATTVGDGSGPFNETMTRTAIADMTGMFYADCIVQHDDSLTMFSELEYLHAWTTFLSGVTDYDVITDGAQNGIADAIVSVGPSGLRVSTLDTTGPTMVTQQLSNFFWNDARAVRGGYLDGASTPSIVAIASSGGGLFRLDDPWGAATLTLITLQQPMVADTLELIEWDGDAQTEVVLANDNEIAVYDLTGVQVVDFNIGSLPSLAVVSEPGVAYDTLVATTTLGGGATEWLLSVNSQFSAPPKMLGAIGVTGIAVGDADDNGYPHVGLHQTLTDDEILFLNRHFLVGPTADLYDWTDYEFFLNVQQIGAPIVDPGANDWAIPVFKDVDNDDDDDYCIPLQEYAVIGVANSNTFDATKQIVEVVQGRYYHEANLPVGDLELDLDLPTPGPALPKLANMNTVTAVVFTAPSPGANPSPAATHFVEETITGVWPHTLTIPLNASVNDDDLFYIMVRAEQKSGGVIVDACPTYILAFTADETAGNTWIDNQYGPTHPRVPVQLIDLITGDKEDDGGLSTPVPDVDCMPDESGDVIPSRCR